MNIVVIIGILIGVGCMTPSVLKKLKYNKYSYAVKATYLGYDVEEEDENGISKRITLKFKYRIFEKEYETKTQKSYILSVTQFESFFSKNGLVEGEEKLVYINPMYPTDISLVGGAKIINVPFIAGAAIAAVTIIFGLIGPAISNSLNHRASENTEYASVEEGDEELNDEDSSKDDALTDEDTTENDMVDGEDGDEAQKGSSKNAKRPSTDTMEGIIAYASSFTDSPKRDEEGEEAVKKGNAGILKEESAMSTSSVSIQRSSLENYIEYEDAEPETVEKTDEDEDTVSENEVREEKEKKPSITIDTTDLYAVYTVMLYEMKKMAGGESYRLSSSDFSSSISEAVDNGNAKATGYIRRDLNHDGTDELIFGEKLEDRTVIYDIYTIEDEEIKHVINGTKDHPIFLCKNGLIAMEGSIDDNQSYVAYFYYHKGNIYLHRTLYLDSSKKENEKWSYSVEGVADTSSAIPMTDKQAEMILTRYAYKDISLASFVN